ncbi:MAG: DUF4160 domain-containing protein [Gemmatimonadales bacterium]|jgi:hypothetical protein|nr:MAG: DUF4160 domain-containing protein [Gemmatimonadales bacterium]
MAVWKQKVAGYEVRIHDADHPPPHCHVIVGGRDVKVDLWSLEVVNPPPNELPGKLRRKLLSLQEELLEAWEQVLEIPPGGSPLWDEQKEDVKDDE